MIAIPSIFSTQALADSYQESYQSYEQTGTTTIPAGWNSNRRCGYRFYSGNQKGSWFYWTAGSSGNENVSSQLTSEYRCNCTLKGGPYTEDVSLNLYGAVCVASTSSNSVATIQTFSSWRSWASSRTCPKGWGKGFLFESSGSNYVRNGQGYVVKSYQVPVYGYVTRYRTVYYNYISGRVAKS